MSLVKENKSTGNDGVSHIYEWNLQGRIIFCAVQFTLLIKKKKKKKKKKKEKEKKQLPKSWARLQFLAIKVFECSAYMQLFGLNLACKEQ